MLGTAYTYCTVMARQHVQLQTLVNRIVHILDGGSVSSTNSSTDVSRTCDPPVGMYFSLPFWSCSHCSLNGFLTCTLTDSGLIFFAARLLLQSGGGLGAGCKGAAELLNGLQQQQQQQVLHGRSSGTVYFPSLCVIALDLNANIG